MSKTKEEVKLGESAVPLDNGWTAPRVAYCIANLSRIDLYLQTYFLAPYLLDVVGLKPGLTGTLLLVKQIFDAISDPLIGHLSDSTRSAYGRRRPYIFLSAPLLWGLWLIFWLDVVQLHDDQMSLFAYYLVCVLMLTVATTCTQMPFFALLQDIAPTYGLRTRMIGIQEMTTMLATAVAVLGQGLLVTAFAYPNGEENLQLGYFVAALVFAPLIAFPRALASLFITERVLNDDGDSDGGKGGNGILESVWHFLRICGQSLRFRDFGFLVIAWTLSMAVLSFVTGNILLYVEYYMREPSKGVWVVVGLQLGVALSLPVWIGIVKFTGKKASLAFGASSCSAILLGSFFLQEDQVTILIIISPLAGLFAGSLFICINAMQPDSCAAFMDKTGYQCEGILYSIFMLGSKLGAAFALSMSSFALGLTGFESSEGQESTVQNDATILLLRLLVFVIPGVLLTGVLVLIFFIKDYRKQYSSVIDRDTSWDDSQNDDTKHFDP